MNFASKKLKTELLISLPNSTGLISKIILEALLSFRTVVTHNPVMDSYNIFNTYVILLV